MAKRKLDGNTNDSTKIIKEPKLLCYNLLEHCALKYDFMISLENIAVAKIIVNLWMNEDIQQEIVDLFYINIKLRKCGFKRKKSQIENKVIAQISELSLSNSMTSKLIGIVPHIGNSIFDWVGYHDDHIFNTNSYSRYSAVNYIDYITWTTRGKIDYAETAKNILADQDSCLTDDHKYKLACTYCIESEIAVLAPKVVDQYYLDCIVFDRYPMVYFWTAYITGDNRKLHNPTYYYDSQLNAMSTNEHIIHLLIKTDDFDNRIANEVPIKYMWNKLSEIEKHKNIIPLVKNLGNQDFRYTLLSSLNKKQQQIVFKECCSSILDSIFNDWLWENYFLPTAFHVLHIMDSSSYIYILGMIINEKNKNSPEANKHAYNRYKSIFKQLWQKVSKRLKSLAIKRSGFVEELVISLLSWKRDMDVIEVIFNDLNTQQKRNLIFGYDGIRHCAHLIQSDQWDLLQLFIKYTLSSEEDLRQFKKTLIKKRGDEIAVHFLDQEEFDKIEYFMRWAFMSDQEINHFKQSLTYSKLCSDKLKLIVKNDTDFTQLERHLQWCASDDPNVLNMLKTKVPKKCSTILYQLIEDERYELLDNILNWCFLGNQQQTEKFKIEMYISC